MKKISVIIPCYNVEQYIDKCYHSLVNQTIGIANLELIFVNDASTDETYNHLLKYEKAYPNSVTVINCETNGRQGTARNIALQYATCDYIAYIDADDWIDPQMLEILYDKAIKYSCDITGCGIDRVVFKNAPQNTDEDGAFFDLTIYTNIEKLFTEEYDMHIVNKLYKKSLITDNLIMFPEQLAYEDIYWEYLIMLYAKRFYLHNKSMYHYFFNEQSTCSINESPIHLDRILTLELFFDETIKRGLYTKYKEIIDYKFVELYFISNLKLFFTKYNTIPVSIIKHLQEGLIKRVPDYVNSYTKYRYFDELLKLANIPLTQELVNKVQDDYIKQLVNILSKQ